MKSLLALPDSNTGRGSTLRLEIARLLIARGQVAEAAAYLDQRPPAGANFNFVLWNLERGSIAKRLGDTARAQRSSALVSAAWTEADEPLRQLAAERHLAVIPRAARSPQK